MIPTLDSPSSTPTARGASLAAANAQRWHKAIKLNQQQETKLGNLVLRLAENEAEVRAAQELRYRIFYDEMQARPTVEQRIAKRDYDSMDQFCDHLIVLDQTKDEVVGTYRLILRDAAKRNGSFYSAAEFDTTALEAYPGEILELGRSCVAEAYRTGSTMQLLWQGIANYVFSHGVEVLFGCASLPGTNVDALKLPLSYLYHEHLAPPALRARAVPQRYVNMDLLPKDSIDQKAAMAALPPLLKGYLRVGGKVGDGAVIDWDFNTTDVYLIVKTEAMSARYRKHFEHSRDLSHKIGPSGNA